MRADERQRERHGFSIGFSIDPYFHIDTKAANARTLAACVIRSNRGFELDNLQPFRDGPISFITQNTYLKQVLCFDDFRKKKVRSVSTSDLLFCTQRERCAQSSRDYRFFAAGCPVVRRSGTVRWRSWP